MFLSDLSLKNIKYGFKEKTFKYCIAVDYINVIVVLCLISLMLELTIICSSVTVKTACHYKCLTKQTGTVSKRQMLNIKFPT